VSFCERLRQRSQKLTVKPGGCLLSSDWRSRYEIAIDAARQAAQLAQRYYAGEFQVEWKADQSPVTVADREAEALLRTRLLGAFPSDGFLGEEHGEHPGSSGFRWVVDPIDGTRSFVRGIPLWGTLVGLEFHSEQIAGVAIASALGETWRALRGDGAYRNDRRIHVSTVNNLADSLIFYSGVSWFQQAGHLDAFLALSGQTDRQRGFGDFYGFVLVAQGSGELMVDHGVKIWDVVALKPIVEEAGGRFTDWEGTQNVYRTDVIASNGLLHDEALRVLKKGATAEHR
jgi:histidinol-phosphatase